MTATDTPDQAEATPFDPAKAEAFSGHLMQILGGGLLSLKVDIGHRTGLFAAAAGGWATSDQLAARAGLTERYVREWLAAMTAAGIVEYDPGAGTFLLPPEHACMLTSPTGVGPLAVTTTIMAKHVPQIVRAFRERGAHAAPLLRRAAPQRAAWPPVSVSVSLVHHSHVGSCEAADAPEVPPGHRLFSL
jgi:hypothetical protein